MELTGMKNGQEALAYCRLLAKNSDEAILKVLDEDGFRNIGVVIVRVYQPIKNFYLMLLEHMKSESGVL
eukprot:6362735-Karenia_brevis.AAC.1